MMDPPCALFLIFLTTTMVTPSQVWLLVEEPTATARDPATNSLLVSGPKAIPCNIQDTGILHGHLLRELY